MIAEEEAVPLIEFGEEHYADMRERLSKLKRDIGGEGQIRPPTTPAA